MSRRFLPLLPLLFTAGILMLLSSGFEIEEQGGSPPGQPPTANGPTPPQTGSAAATGAVRPALWQFAGAPAGDADGLRPAFAAASRGRNVLPEGRRWRVENFPDVRAMHEGERVSVALPDGRALTGTVFWSRRDPGFADRHLVSVALDQPGGSLVLSEDGAAGAEGQLLVNGERLAWTIGQNNGAPWLVEHLREDLICELPVQVAAMRQEPLPGDPSVTPDGTIIPILNSRPGATGALYIDLDGEPTMIHPNWPGGNPPVPIPVPHSGVTAEQATKLWRRVAEDFAPFNVNVTTELAKYDAAPVGKRMRIIIGATLSAHVRGAGVAHMRSFRAGPGVDSRNPCWMSTDAYNGGGFGDGQIAAMASNISHEFGHTMGLWHDGDAGPQPTDADADAGASYYTGHGIAPNDWAPIMGGPAPGGVVRRILQWSKGDYPAANNLQDDLAVLSGAANGIGYAPDESTGRTNAGVLTPTGTSQQVGGGGVIAHRNDEDWWRFTVAFPGSVTVEVAPADEALALPNLDCGFRLEDVAGNLVSGPFQLQDNLEIIATGPLAAGTYYLVAFGVGNLSFSNATGYDNYGSNGRYLVTAILPSDGSAPAVHVASPAHGSVLTGGPIQFSGTATDNDSVSALALYLRRNADGTWWNGSYWQVGSGGAALASSFNAGTGQWLCTAPLPQAGGSGPGALNAGSYAFIAIAGDPSGQSAQAESVVTVDSSGPGVSITSPLSGSLIGAPGFTFTGTITDDGNIAGVPLYLRRNADGHFWNGSAWQASPTGANLAAALTPVPLSNVVNWACTSPLPQLGSTFTPGSYNFIAIGVDGIGNTLQVDASIIVDGIAPVTAITEPLHGEVIYDNPITLRGTITDNGGVWRVVCFIRRHADNLYWNGSAWVADSGAANLSASYNAGAGTWACTDTLPAAGGALANGGYNFIALGFDHAGNTHQVDSVVTVDYHRIYTWNGSVGNAWETAANWTPNGVPGAEDYVIHLNSDTIINSAVRTVRGIRLSAGAICSGDGASLTTTHDSTWTGGWMGGAWTNASGAGMIVSGAAPKYFHDSTVLNNAGLFEWRGGGTLTAQGAAGTPVTINNQAGGVFRIAGDGNLFILSSSLNVLPVFNNLTGGRIEKTGSAGIAYWYYWTLNNDSDIFLNSGELYPYANTVHFRGASALMGTGLFRLNTAFHLHTNLFATARTEFIGGFVSCEGNAERTWSGPGVLNWSAGTLYGKLTRTAGTTTSIMGGDHKELADGCEIINEGALTWTGDGSLRARCEAAPGPVIRNRGTFTANTPGDFIKMFGNVAANFSNEAGATFTKLNANTTHSIWQFHNAATVNVLQGWLEWHADGTQSGTFNIAANSVLHMFAGAHLVAAGTLFSGSGAVLLNGASVSANGVLQNELGGGIELRNGWLTTNPQLRGSGLWKWTGGGMAGSISLGAGCHLDVSGTANIKEFWDDTTFDNYGTFTWQGGPQMRARNYSGASLVFNNHSIFRLAADGSPLTLLYGNGTTVFNNKPGARIEKTAGTGIAYWYHWTLNNESEIALPSGDIYFYLNRVNLREGSVVTGNGTLWLNTAAYLYAARLHSTAATNFLGNFLAAEGGTRTWAGPGLFTWTAGTLYGSLKLEAGVSSVFSGSDTKEMADDAEIINEGAITWTGAGSIRGRSQAGAGALIRNRGTFTADTPGDLDKIYGDVDSQFYNEAGATFTKLNPETTHSLWRFHNAGTVNINQGWLQWHASGTHTGSFNIADGAVLHCYAGTQEMADGTPFNGDGMALFNGSTINAAGVLMNNLTGGVELRNGWLSVNPQLRGTGPWHWTGGGISGTASLGTGCTLDVSGAGNIKEFWDDTTFDNYGTFTWQGGPQIRSRNHSGAPLVFNNHGTFRFAADGVPLTKLYGNSDTVFNNLPGARIEKTGGPGIAYWYYWTLNNESEIALPTGGLYFYLNRTNLREGSVITGNGTLWLNTEAYLYAARLHSTAATNWLGVYLAADGGTRTWAGPGLFTWSNGTLYGSLKFAAGTPAVVSGSDVKTMADDSEIINDGDLTYTGTGFIRAYCYSGTAPAIRNCPGGVFRANTTSSLQRNYGNLTAIFENSGSVEIGAGEFYLNGWNFTQLPGGAIYSDITATGHDQIYITTGNVTAAGNLHLRRAPGFTPPQGTNYNVLTGTSRAGTFANVTGGFTADYQPTIARVTAEPPAQTYAEWIAAAGFSGANAATTADPDHDGMDNYAEFAFHQNPALSGDSTITGSTLEIEGDIWLILHYRRWSDREQAGVTYSPQAAPELAAWSVASLIDEPDSVAAPLAGSSPWRARIKVSEARRFLRVSVSGPP